MKKAVIILGMGEIGGVFARGFLKSGYPVYPVNRDTKIEDVLSEVKDPEVVVVAVGEKDIASILQDIPDQWKDRLVLLQNELLPCDWKTHNLNPTVISVWFEKKQPKDYKVIIPSPVFGEKAQLIKDALNSINISVNVLDSEDELLKELIIKNLYILTSNVSGLEVGGNVGELWNKHKEVALSVANDVLDIQFLLAEKELSREELIKGMVAAFDGDPEHNCMGRSSSARLDRALILSDKFGLASEKLRVIKQKTKNDG